MICEPWARYVVSCLGEGVAIIDVRPAQLLHLHPLTLEDILQQESREKLEVFPRLGYYFIVFRAIEAQYPADQDPAGGSKAAETVIAVNLYLVIFKEGICSVCPDG